MSLRLQNVTKSYRRSNGRRRRSSGDGRVAALTGIDLEAAEDELLVVVGPSGSGKTTLLRCIAGLEQVDDGTIAVGGRDVTDLSPRERDVAMVFQDLALFPHLDVERNISFGLKARKVDPQAIARKVSEAAELLSLEGVLDRAPQELSGGERQRVALARAIVRSPKAFLMDEPLSNLDPELRVHTRIEIRALQQRLHTTTVYVTHDQVEAMTVGDRVAVLKDGALEQVAAPMTLYDHPSTVFVARFMGNPPMNVFPTTIHRGPHGSAHLGIRPENVDLVAPSEGRLVGRVVTVERIGAEAIVHVASGEVRLLVRSPIAEARDPGAEVGLGFEDKDLHAFDGQGRAMS